MTAAAQARYAARRRATDPVAFRAEQVAKAARFRALHPDRKAAWNAVYQAVRKGRLIRPDSCERCGVSCVPDASHRDYTQRLIVEWLCRPCHSAKDAQLRKGN